MSTLATGKAAAPLEHWRALFEASWSTEDALKKLRREALEEFLAAGFPTIRQEDWKYTNLRRLEARRFTLADRAGLDPGSPGKMRASQSPGLAAAATLQERWLDDIGMRIVLVNGRWEPGLGSGSTPPPGVALRGLSQWHLHDANAVAKYLSDSLAPQSGAARIDPTPIPFNSRQGHRPAPRRSPLEQLNLAFTQDGMIIDIGDDLDIEPLYIVHQVDAADAGQAGTVSGAPVALRMLHPRIILRIGRNSRCTLIEHFLAPPDSEYFTNAVTHIEVGQGAAVTHHRLQMESPRSFHLAHIDAHVQAQGRYTCHDIALGASLARVGLNVGLDGPGAHAALHGLFVPLGSQHLDAHTRIDHLAAHTSSEEDYRGVAGDRGRGVFNGKVVVHPRAQKVDARQSSRNLLLSAGAQIDTKPELEIYADDVKCAHGATVGQIDATAMFYLRSRGLSEEEARALLIRAFAESVLAQMEPPALRTHLEHHMEQLFFAAPHPPSDTLRHDLHGTTQ